MGLKLNLSGVKEDQARDPFEPIRAGTYDVEVVSAEIKPTKGGPNAALPAGTPRLVIGLAILEEPYASAGRRVWATYNLPEDHPSRQVSEERLYRDLQGLGFSREQLRAEEGLDLDLDGNDPDRSLVGRRGRARVTVRGEYNDVSAILAAGVGADEASLVR
jgi:hypothetical protein